MEMKNRVDVKQSSNLSIRQKRRGKKNIASEMFTDYCANTSIHGIGYLGAKDKTYPEKIWWIVIFGLSVTACCYLIAKTWIKWKNNPVILSFEQEQTAVWRIPFPSVTICPVNRVDHLFYNYTEMFRNRNNIEEEKYKEFWDISLICDLEQYDIPYNCSLNITDEEAISNILKAAPDNNIFGQVRWQNQEYTRHDRMFAELLTQEGVCFTFNSFSQKDMFTDALNHKIVYINHSTNNAGWNLENGFSSTSNSLDDHPRRTAKDGYGSGLSVILLHIKNNTDYVCGPPISGYKIILHNPAETPRPTQQYYLIPLDKQATLIVKPELTTTSENLRYMPHTDRKCYFSNEKSLRFFKVYTQSNCRTECAVNVTQSICACAPFYMPHDAETPICGFASVACINEVEDKILDFEMIEKGINATSEAKDTEEYKIFDSCNCLPSCSNLQFSAETSQTKLHVIETFIATGEFEDMEQEMIDELRKGLIQMTQVDIFFKESQFLALHRSELYGQTDFIANCGGLLGLFMGFSFLSLIEIFYFLTIRLWFKCRGRKKTLQ